MMPPFFACYPISLPYQAQWLKARSVAKGVCLCFKEKPFALCSPWVRVEVWAPATIPLLQEPEGPIIVPQGQPALLG